ncbi:MAG: molybdopterin molybdenumtransferase MoeA, partial [Proteobacteria bacterium]|nr:molybdopterin molybdenumtransferase MoeA [Pseudomonadota bacterium]
MAQLKDDCFAFGGDLMPVAQALALIAEIGRPLTANEAVPLAAASGRILGEDIVAPMNVPPHD